MIDFESEKSEKFTESNKNDSIKDNEKHDDSETNERNKILEKKIEKGTIETIEKRNSIMMKLN